MACCLLATSCDMDIVPKGQSTLQRTTVLELMLNSKTISGRPHETLGLVVNEGYGSGFTTIKTNRGREHCHRNLSHLQRKCRPWSSRHQGQHL